MDKKLGRNGRRQDGTHIILNLTFKNFPKELHSVTFYRKLFARALEAGGFKIIQLGFHKFQPTGLTGFFLLSESHLSFHTWPEYNYIALDLFTCGSEPEAQKTIDCFLKEFRRLTLLEIEEKRMKRGYVYQQQQN